MISHQGFRRVRSRKIRVSLPEPVIQWLVSEAEAHHLTTAEYLRVLTVKLFAHRDRLFLLFKRPDRASTNEPTESTEPTRRYKGVHRYGKRWAAWIWDRERKRNCRIGVFDTPEEAARAYDDAARAKHGRTVNFPDEHDKALAAATPFLEKLARGTLSDDDWEVWKATRTPSPASDRSEIEPKAELEVEPKAERHSDSDASSGYDAPIVPPLPVDDASRAPLVTGSPITIRRRPPRPDPDL